MITTNFQNFDNMDFWAWCGLKDGILTGIILSNYKLTPQENMSMLYTRYLETKNNQISNIRSLQRLYRKLAEKIIQKQRDD